LRNGLNGLEADHQWGQDVVTNMAVEGLMALELNPNAANAVEAEGGEGKDD
jgi:hypothetical protein